MVKVTVYKNKNGEYTGFDADGHAGYGEYGHDIVCAAASALIINTVNSVGRFTQDKFDCKEDDGKISFHFSGFPVSHDAGLLLDSLVLGLSEIKNSGEYEPYIDIICKEVQQP